MQLLEMRSGAFIAELVDESVSCEPEQAPSVAQEGSTAGVYEGSSIGVPRYPAQKRRRPRASTTVATSDDEDDHGMRKKSGRISLDEPLDPVIEDGTFEDI